MSFVEVRNQKRKEELTKIRSLLAPGDMSKIQEIAGVSYRAVTDTLNEKHPLYSQKVIAAAWEYLKSEGRIKHQSL